MHLWDQSAQRARHRNPLKNGSLSENVMKEGERVLFQPLHWKINRRGLRCGQFETSTDLVALFMQFWQFFSWTHFVKSQFKEQSSWCVLGWYLASIHEMIYKGSNTCDIFIFTFSKIYISSYSHISISYFLSVGDQALVMRGIQVKTIIRLSSSFSSYTLLIQTSTMSDRGCSSTEVF